MCELARLTFCNTSFLTGYFAVYKVTAFLGKVSYGVPRSCLVGFRASKGAGFVVAFL